MVAACTAIFSAAQSSFQMSAVCARVCKGEKLYSAEVIVSIVGRIIEERVLWEVNEDLEEAKADVAKD